MKIEASWLHLVGVAAMSIAGILVGTAAAQNEDAAARARAIRSMIVKWAGNHDTDAFLRQPAVRSELQKLLGSELDHLMHNLNVRGAVDLNGQTLSVNGNAPHQGTEEEAIVCVGAGSMAVEAAILSKETVTVYTRAEKYEHASICIKDWITLANSRHADRFAQPANVRVMKPQY
jgi:hypothetical protein